MPSLVPNDGACPIKVRRPLVAARRTKRGRARPSAFFYFDNLNLLGRTRKIESGMLANRICCSIRVRLPRVATRTQHHNAQRNGALHHVSLQRVANTYIRRAEKRNSKAQRAREGLTARPGPRVQVDETRMTRRRGNASRQLVLELRDPRLRRGEIVSVSLVHSYVCIRGPGGRFTACS